MIWITADRGANPNDQSPDHHDHGEQQIAVARADRNRGPLLTPMCWSTPTVVEVVDVVERNAIRTMFWRPETTRRR